MRNTIVRKLTLSLIAFYALVNETEATTTAAEEQYRLGRSYYKGEGVAVNKGKAIDCYRKAAEQNHAHAQVKLGACYFNGDGVAKDYKEAVKWFQMAAEQGDVDGQVSLGISCLQGLGIDQNEVEAEKWFHKAAEQGVSNSELFKEAQQGDAECQSFIGTRYMYVEKDPQEAAKWYRMAASQGLANAQYALGMHYLWGVGVDKDEGEAIQLLRKAAEQGQPDAQFILGLCYLKGDGVEKDRSEAVNWFHKAAAHGQPNARDILNKLEMDDVCHVYESIGYCVGTIIGVYLIWAAFRLICCMIRRLLRKQGKHMAFPWWFMLLALPSLAKEWRGIYGQNRIEVFFMVFVYVLIVAGHWRINRRDKKQASEYNASNGIRQQHDAD